MSNTVSNLMSRAKLLNESLQRIALKQNHEINVDHLSAGGLLNPAQRNRFLDYIFDTTDLLKACRTEIMPAPTYQIDGLLMTQNKMRRVGINNNVAVTQGEFDRENQTPFLRGVNSFQIELIAKEFSLAYGLSRNLLKDNIEGRALADKIARYFAACAGLDMENVLINGAEIGTGLNLEVTSITIGVGAQIQFNIAFGDFLDLPPDSTTGYIRMDVAPLAYPAQGGYELIEYANLDLLTGLADVVSRGVYDDDYGWATVDQGALGAGAYPATWHKHHLLGGLNGWLWHIYNPDVGEPGAQFLDAQTINTGDICEQHFFAAIKLLPKRYAASLQGSLRWIINRNTFINVNEMISRRSSGGTLADSIIQGNSWNPLGYPVLLSSQFPEDKILLTTPQNLIAGVWDQLWINSTNQGVTSLMTNRSFFRTGIRFDGQVERKDACVLIDSINTVLPTLP